MSDFLKSISGFFAVDTCFDVGQISINFTTIPTFKALLFERILEVDVLRFYQTSIGSAGSCH